LPGELSSLHPDKLQKKKVMPMEREKARSFRVCHPLEAHKTRAKGLETRGKQRRTGTGKNQNQFNGLWNP
jgi:hypothetical protein